MSRAKVGLAVLAILLVVAGAVVRFAGNAAASVSVDVTGTPRLPIRGTSVVDGKTSTFTGTVPMRFVLTGDSVTFSLESDAASGEFRVEASARCTPGLGPSGGSTVARAPDDVVGVWAECSWFVPRCDVGVSNEKAAGRTPR